MRWRSISGCITFRRRSAPWARRVGCCARAGRVGFTVWALPDEHTLHRIALDAVRDSQTCIRLLAEAGFDVTVVRVEKLSAVLRLDSVADLVHLLQYGTVRLSALINPQSRDQSAAILDGIERAAAKYQRNGQLEIPLVATLAVATRR
jgi:hypothetical protein